MCVAFPGLQVIDSSEQTVFGENPVKNYIFFSFCENKNAKITIHNKTAIEISVKNNCKYDPPPPPHLYSIHNEEKLRSAGWKHHVVYARQDNLKAALIS